MNDLRHMFPRRGNAEGYCRNCNQPLGISGQCSVCALNESPALATLVGFWSGLNSENPKTLTLNTGMIIKLNPHEHAYWESFCGWVD